jgi:hypothetical protein
LIIITSSISSRVYIKLHYKYYSGFSVSTFLPLISPSTTATNRTNNTQTTTTKMVSFHITEPHPSVGGSYIYSGRGGAGNVTRVKANDLTHGATASGPASCTKLIPPPSTSYFASGRGGAGNMHSAKERAMFCFDEELQQQERLRSQQAPVYHVGRGGAGNLVDEMKPRSQRTNSSSSTSSNESVKEGVRRSVGSAFSRMSRTFSHTSN